MARKKNNDSSCGCLLITAIAALFIAITISGPLFPEGSILAEKWFARFVAAMLLLFVITGGLWLLLKLIYPNAGKSSHDTEEDYNDEETEADDDTLTFTMAVETKEVDNSSATQKQPIVPTTKLGDEPYFAMCKEQAEAIYAFIESLESDTDFCTNLKENVQGLDEIDTLVDFKGHNNRIAVMMLVDMLKCYKMLGHRLSASSREFLCLNLLVSRLLWDNSNFEASYVDKNSEASDMSAKICQAFSTVQSPTLDDEPYGFLFAVVLRIFAAHKHKEYMVLLYRFSSIVAKADGIIAPKETEWLSGLLKAAPSDSHSTESSDNTSYRGELNDLIGLAAVKAEVTKLSNFIKIQQERTHKGLKAIPISYHCVFTGNPGTGKTTVARIIASIYKDLGILTKGHLVETDRAGLVGEYVGQTAVKTNKIIDSALDGMLFIDEAYSLVNGDSKDYGAEAIATLLKRMEDDRSRLVVILAGYGDEMKRFIDSNPGLQSRFNRYIHFDDYNADELVQIFEMYVKKHDYVMDQQATEALKHSIAYAVAHKDKNFGNARFVRNLFERTLEQQAMRLASETTLTKEALQLLTAPDIAR